MIGYVIGNSVYPIYLNRGRVWYHEKPQDAFVFSDEKTKEILTAAIRDNWRIKPTHIIRARWTEENGVQITGNPVPAY